jgi:dihydrofolate reductase
MAENRVIGNAGALPWHLPADMRHFKETTTGHAVIMGRKTWETFGGALPSRRNVVVTRQTEYAAAGAEVVHTLDDALALVVDDPEVFVAGGEEIYRLALPRAHRIHLTVVHVSVEGDAIFPEFAMTEWELRHDVRFPADERHRFAYSFRRYERTSDSHHEVRVGR